MLNHGFRLEARGLMWSVFFAPGAERNEKSDSRERDEGTLKVGFFPEALFSDGKKCLSLGHFPWSPLLPVCPVAKLLGENEAAKPSKIWNFGLVLPTRDPSPFLFSACPCWSRWGVGWGVSLQWFGSKETDWVERGVGRGCHGRRGTHRAALSGCRFGQEKSSVGQALGKIRVSCGVRAAGLRTALRLGEWTQAGRMWKGKRSAAAKRKSMKKAQIISMKGSLLPALENRKELLRIL